MKGLNETFLRWEDFLKVFEVVDKANFLAKSHNKSLNSPVLYKEYQKAVEMRMDFVKNFQKEISNFCSENKNIFSSCVEGFKNLLNLVNTNVIKM